MGSFEEALMGGVIWCWGVSGELYVVRIIEGVGDKAK